MARIADDILCFLKHHPSVSSGEIHRAVGKGSLSTTKRAIAVLVETGQLLTQGQTRTTRYVLSPANQLLVPIDMVVYFEKEIDEPKIQETFNFQLITKILYDVDLFTAEE